ncbi:MAG: DNA repair protein RecN [Desulfosalsimonadaceae bacterium]
MLREIFIKNFAIIDELRIDFSEGLTILSGETGAGKSIIISALNILLGGRADSGMIRTGADTAELEALFDIDRKSAAGGILQEQGYEETDQLVIRRILSAGNRHRVYINGRMATMTILSAITQNIAGISGQHEHLRLLRESEQLQILDQFGNLTGLRDAVGDAYAQILPEIKNIEELRHARESQVEQIALLELEKKEIEEAALQPGEDESLHQELRRLKNATALYQGIGNGVEALYNSEGAISDQLFAVKKDIEKAAEIDPFLAEAAKSLDEALFRVQDIAHQLRSYLDTITFDPARTDTVEARMHIVNRLKRKYGPTLDDVFNRLDRVSRELAETMNIDERIKNAEATLAARHKELVQAARRLTEKRRRSADVLARKMEAELTSVNMPDTRFEVIFRPVEIRSDTPAALCDNGHGINERGAEQPVFMISPNVGEDLKPLSKIASGGELSRVILALKAILVDTEPVETVIFDEVDAGIGGKTAAVVGKKLAGLAVSSQVICITHLAQIAKFGNRHFRIEKYVEDGRTSARITPLDESSRIEEMARMIGGQTVTETSRAHAAELLAGTGRKN